MSTSFRCIPEITVANHWPTGGCTHRGVCVARMARPKTWLETALGNLEKRGAEPEVEQETDS